MKIENIDVDESYNGITFDKFADHKGIIFLKQCLKTIYDSNINNELKYSIFIRFMDDSSSIELYNNAIDFLKAQLQYGIVCEVDSWIEVCEEINGETIDIENVDDYFLTDIIINEFKKLGNNFPFDIISGDFTTLYKAKKNI